VRTSTAPGAENNFTPAGINRRETVLPLCDRRLSRSLSGPRSLIPCIHTARDRGATALRGPCLGGFHIDAQYELGRKLHGQLAQGRHCFLRSNDSRGWSGLGPILSGGESLACDICGIVRCFFLCRDSCERDKQHDHDRNIYDREEHPLGDWHHVGFSDVFSSRCISAP